MLNKLEIMGQATNLSIINETEIEITVLTKKDNAGIFGETVSIPVKIQSLNKDRILQQLKKNDTVLIIGRVIMSSTGNLIAIADKLFISNEMKGFNTEH